MLIKFDNFRLYTQLASGIRFPQNPKKPYLLVYLSENSTFLDDYSKLGFRPIDARIVVVPITKIPKTRLLPDTRKLYKKLGLFSYNSNMKIPEGKNLIFDLSNYLHNLDTIFKVKTYRQRAGFLLKNLILKSFEGYPPNYNKVLLYSVDATKPMNKFIDRKSFPILQLIKEGSIPFEHMVLTIISEYSSRHRLLIKDKDFSFPKIIQFTKTIKKLDLEEEHKEEVEKGTENVIKKIEKHVDPEDKKKVKSAVSSLLSKDKNTREKVSKGLNDTDAEEIASTALMYRTSGDIQKAKRIAKAVPEEKKSKLLKAISKTFADELLEPQETKNSSTEVSIQSYDIPDVVDNKSPEHIFQKRQVDFEINLKKDINNSFKVLEKKEVPLKVESIEVKPKPQKRGEIEKSDISTIETVLKDEFGNKHNIQIELPNIDPISGTFRVNGKRKALINQIVQCPITFPKPYDSRFESAYSRFHIRSKRTKKTKYLEGYMATYRIPLMILLSYSFGFEETSKDYGIKYKLLDNDPKEKYSSKVNSTKYILFENVNNEVKEELCQSFVQAKVFNHNIKKEFGTKEYFNDLIISMTGQIKSTFLIMSNIENIVDPVAKQVLANQQLPTDLRMIMKYMTEKVITGYLIDRNDISNQRIRGSEVLVQLAQKQILAAYTEYKEQVLSGNKEAKFDISPKKVLSSFINSEIVTDMEYANPLEEMSTMSRISPVGKEIGGIPDKTSIQISARNVHPSYFGNIDPLDTPEGANIGVVQQLTIDSLITSARGLIQTKPINNSEKSGMLSTSTCMIPFVENNEGARVMMAANQSRQMLPLKNPDSPAIQSGYESVLTNVLSDSYIKRSPCNGKIINVTDDFITILCNDNKTQRIDITPVHLKSGSGKNTLSVFKPLVKRGQIVKNNSVVAEGSCISNGTISLGKTLCVAVFPYKGYNFEDGVVLSESLTKNDKLTSLHGVEEEVLISKDDRILYLIDIGTKTEKGQPLLRKSIGEIEQLIGYDEEDETSDITAGQFIKKSPGGIVVDVEVYSNMDESKFPNIKHLIDRTKKKYGMTTKDKFIVRGEAIQGVLVKFKIEQELKIGLGDKLCNRYGNKGIVSLVEKEEYMPLTPWGDRVEMIINPLGIIGRMNIGQLYELYCGLISKRIAMFISSVKDQQKTVALLKQVLPLLDKDKSKKFSTKFINSIRSLSKLKFQEMLDQIQNKGFFPIIIPPFKAPNNNDLMSALKILKLSTGYELRLPEFNTKTKAKVPVGYQYISKLEHIGDLKLHARSTGPVTGKTLQPTAGKKKEGGQRMGELDTYSIISYDCPAVLAEFFGPLSDDHITKNEIISDIVQTGSADYRVAKTAPVRDLLNSYFVALMLGK